MTCFLVDDQLMQNAKIQAAIDQAASGLVVSLWTAAGSSCGAANSEGLIAPSVLSWAAKNLYIDRDTVLPVLVAALVDNRIWHDAKALRRCPSCREYLQSVGIPKAPADHLVWHDWNQQQFSRKEAKDPIARSSRNRKRALHRDADLVRAIRDRDGPYCRYCGDWVNFDARTGDKAGTYDHKDPDCFEPNGGNFLDGVVVACGLCNRLKGHRTPSEWLRDGGLPLRPSPDRRSELPDPPVRTGSTGGQDEAKPGSGLADAPAGVGPGQEGVRTGQADGSGLVLVGSGPGLPGVESFHLTERTEQQ